MFVGPTVRSRSRNPFGTYSVSTFDNEAASVAMQSRVPPVAEGLYTLTNVRSCLLLAVKNAGTDLREDVVQYNEDMTGRFQEWRLIPLSAENGQPSGEYRLEASHSNLVLDVVKGSWSNGAGEPSPGTSASEEHSRLVAHVVNHLAGRVRPRSCPASGPASTRACGNHRLRWVTASTPSPWPIRYPASHGIPATEASSVVLPPSWTSRSWPLPTGAGRARSPKPPAPALAADSSSALISLLTIYHLSISRCSGKEAGGSSAPETEDCGPPFPVARHGCTGESAPVGANGAAVIAVRFPEMLTGNPAFRWKTPGDAISVPSRPLISL